LILLRQYYVNGNILALMKELAKSEKLFDYATIHCSVIDANDDSSKMSDNRWICSIS